MREFKTYHPVVNFIYFVFVIGFSCFLMHPVCLFVSLACSFLYSVMLKGRQAIKTNLLFLLPVMLLTALINPAFNHEGITVLTYLPGGNPVTLESVVYGLCAAAMLVSVICWFSCYNQIMTGDKFMYLFGKILPALSLVISMTLRFVPKFAAQLKVVINARRCLGQDISSGGIIKRAKNGLAVLSVMTTWSLENAIETADSMRSRGYGIPGRTAFSVFTFDRRDRKALICIVVLGLYLLVGYVAGGLTFHYFPFIAGVQPSFYSISVFLSYIGLCLCPIIIELWEVRKWRILQLKI
ncbi:MAG: energy-coupling factor transporter transmembrane protein EcfT [Clostridia bacterium]|nr:energy-coupling factor transporter transmembrane protein EcfT [Clostridia bacterium]